MPPNLVPDKSVKQLYVARLDLMNASPPRLSRRGVMPVKRLYCEKPFRHFNWKLLRLKK